MQALGLIADVAVDGADVDGEVQPALPTGRGAGAADLPHLAVGERLTTRHWRLLVPWRRRGRRRAPGPARPVRGTTSGRGSTAGPGDSAAGATATAAPRRTL